MSTKVVLLINFRFFEKPDFFPDLLVLAGVWAVLGEEHSVPKGAGAVPAVEPQVPEVVGVVQGEVHKVREVRVNAVLRTKRPALATGGKGYRLLKTVVPKQGDDNLTFINVEVGPAKAPAWLQVDPGSDITCVRGIGYYLKAPAWLQGRRVCAGHRYGRGAGGAHHT
jgi:hypothetical protein